MNRKERRAHTARTRRLAKHPVTITLPSVLSPENEALLRQEAAQMGMPNLHIIYDLNNDSTASEAVEEESQ